MSLTTKAALPRPMLSWYLRLDGLKTQPVLMMALLRSMNVNALFQTVSRRRRLIFREKRNASKHIAFPSTNSTWAGNTLTWSLHISIDEMHKSSVSQQFSAVLSRRRMLLLLPLQPKETPYGASEMRVLLALVAFLSTTPSCNSVAAVQPKR